MPRYTVTMHALARVPASATPETPRAPHHHSPLRAQEEYWNSPAGRASLAKYPETSSGPVLYPYFSR